MKRKEINFSEVSDFIIYFIMYIFTCFVGVVFVDFAKNNNFIIQIINFKIDGASLLSFIFIAIILILLSELNKYKKSISKFIYQIIKHYLNLSKDIEAGLDNLLLAFLLVPLLVVSNTYFSPLIGSFSIVIIIIIFIAIYYHIFQFLKSWKSDIERGIINLYNYIKKKKEEIEKEEEEKS